MSGVSPLVMWRPQRRATVDPAPVGQEHCSASNPQGGEERRSDDGWEESDGTDAGYRDSTEADRAAADEPGDPTCAKVHRISAGEALATRPVVAA